MVKRNLLLSLTINNIQALKVLHLSFHRACIQEFEYVAKQLGLELTSIFVQDQPPLWFDGKTKGNGIYNIGHDRAQRVWNKHKNFFEQFDVVVTSDTAPLSRIFLQNGWTKPLLIWVCNRFDYHDGASLDCDFPDKEYYQLFKNALRQKNVTFISYTPFEQYYAHTRGISLGALVIKPCAKPSCVCTKSSIPAEINKQETFFIPPYLNDTEFMNMAAQCQKLGIPAYNGRYNGPADLIGFKGIIHLPYAWSNLALFENIQNGIPYFIPSKQFVLQMTKQGNYFFMMLAPNTIEYSEWYSPEHKDILTYFDSWEDLQHKIATTDFVALKQRIAEFAHKHHETMINRWKKLFLHAQRI